MNRKVGALIWGFAGAAGMLGLYLLLLTLAESWQHALSLLREDARAVAPLALGFGIQLGLYVYLRSAIKAAAHLNGAMTGGSGGTSTLAMVACCAHHLTDLLPLAGFSVAATLLAQFKPWLIAVALGLNAIGIGILVYRIIHFYRRLSGNPASPRPASVDLTPVPAYPISDQKGACH